MTSAATVDGSVRDATEAARGALYALFAVLFDEPDDELYDALVAGDVEAELADLFERAELDVAVPDDATVPDDDRDLLSARFNDVFVVGYPEPPVPLYESEYRDDSWHDVNLDLARAYEYFDVTVNQTNRDHHDNLGLELEFAGYLARRAALADGSSDARRARHDFLDRHLSVLADGIKDGVASEPDTGIYGALSELLAAFVRADRADLAVDLGIEEGNRT